MAQAGVRTATADDVATLAALHRETWRVGYAELLPRDVLDGLDGPENAQAWAAAVDGGATVLIANEGGADVGFCVAGPAPAEEIAAADGTPPPDAESAALISTLLVAPRWGRRGHGGRLLAAAATQLREAGARRGVAWVPAEDPASLGFYRRAGWELDNTVRTLDAGGRPLREVRLTGPLDLPLSDPSEQGETA
ncbi:MAG: GNAT family N-acetyltransferase [Pseudonocardiaceae bacterium]|nr:GNAT family N-acetyltransferase [Pseudonocardiaceae bacterium]